LLKVSATIFEQNSFPTRRSSDLLKGLLHNQNTPISIQINNLINQGLLKKSRDAYDERCIQLHDIDLVKIKSIIEQYHLIVESILDRKSTRLNSSHVSISYAVFCL